MFLLIMLIMLFIYPAFAGWMFMLMVGVIHAEWIPQVPTIGFWWAFVVMLLWRAANFTFHSSNKD